LCVLWPDSVAAAWNRADSLRAFQQGVIAAGASTGIADTDIAAVSCETAGLLIVLPWHGEFSYVF
jgi:hypothetical protein